MASENSSGDESDLLLECEEEEFVEHPEEQADALDIIFPYRFEPEIPVEEQDCAVHEGQGQDRLLNLPAWAAPGHPMENWSEL